MKPKEAFEILRDTPIDIRSTREDDIHNLYATAQNMALDALQLQMWIPCSERLPEDNETVIFTTKDGIVEAGWYDAKKNWCVNFPRAFGFIAWMPLPEPYKEGDSVG